MGVSLQLYRCRIGNFLPNNLKLVQKRRKSISSMKIQFSIIVSVLVVTALVLSSMKYQDCYSTSSYTSSQSFHSLKSPISFQQCSCHQELSNFHARYVYGNKQGKGMKIAHFNKSQGFLASKIRILKIVLFDT